MRIAGIASMLPIAVMCAPSAAQFEPTQKMNSHQAEFVLSVFADCMVKRKKAQGDLAAFLRKIPGGADFYPAATKAADLTCLNDEASLRRSKLEMTMKPATFRDATYPALYRRDFGEGPVPLNIAALPPLDLAKEFDGDLAGLPSEYRPFRAFGDCIARENTAQAHAMLLTRPWSKQETAAVEALKPALAGCLSDGQTATLNRASLRAFLGEAMYKLATASKAG